MLLLPQADLSVCDNVGKQAIHHAAQAGNLPSIKYLITKHRIDPKTLTATSGMTPAHLAAKVKTASHYIMYMLKSFSILFTRSSCRHVSKERV